MNAQEILALFRQLSPSENIIGVGQGHKWIRGEDTKREAVTILVKEKKSKSDLKRSDILPSKIDGILTDIIEVGDIRLQNERTKFQRPAQPGVSIGHYKISAGTFGAVVKDRDTGELLILSNNHVLANLTNGVDKRSTIGDIILQPGIFDNGDKEKSVIGHLARFVPLHKEANASTCKFANFFERMLNSLITTFKPHYHVRVLRESEKVNEVDCAVATPVDPNQIVPEVLECGPIVGVKDPVTGMAIKKSGRSSGLTFSMVLATDVTLKVNLDSGEYGIFSNQVLSGPMSMPGDSGSIILTEDNYAVGLLFAGSEQVTIFNRIDRVLDALNVSL